MKRKFKKGDIVLVSNLPSWMSHFQSGIGVVTGRGTDGDIGSLCKHIDECFVWFAKSGSESGWYPDSVMTLVDPTPFQKDWMKERKERAKQLQKETL